MGYLLDKENKQLNDYYKMLTFLNEATDDHLFLWDLRKDTIFFARELSNSRIVKQNTQGYSFDTFLDGIYKKDRDYVRFVLGNIQNGQKSEFDFDTRVYDDFHGKVWMNCRGKAILDESKTSALVIGRLSGSVLADKMDLLTGLMNYNKMMEDLGHKQGRNKYGHLLILGIDDFKALNQRFGRSYGNTVLKKFSEILESVGQDHVLIYRLDGDHFAVDLEGYGKDRAEMYYQTIRERVREFCTISSGAVYYPVTGEQDAGLLVQYAENAMDRAKKKGKDRLEFFSSEDYQKYMYQVELREELKHSVQAGFQGFEVFYQPQVILGRYKIHGAEALLRYTSKQYGSVPPNIFIPILEKTGLMIPVGNWVMQKAFLQCAKWRKFHQNFRMSVNASYLQLREQGMTEVIAKALKRAGIPGNAVSIELTESMQLQDYQYYNYIFSRWREWGIRVAIDDFGTGYSSLSYLKGLEIDEIKIDRCFVNQIQNSAYNYKLLHNMIELAHSAQISVCCEGIEFEEELECLNRLQPEILQGFLFGKPVSALDFEQRYLKKSFQYQHLIKDWENRTEMEHIPKLFVEDGNREESFRYILDNLETIIYVTDRESNEIYYMNNSAKKLTGVFDYEGKKCYSVIFGKKDICDDCNKNQVQWQEFCYRQLHNPYLKEDVFIREKLMYWYGRECRLVFARTLDKGDRWLNQQRSDDLYVSDQVIRLMECSGKSQEIQQTVNIVLQHVAQFYEADRTYLYLYQQEMDVWQNVGEYQAPGIVPRAQCHQTVESGFLLPWIEILKKNKDTVILKRDALGEDKNELIEAMQIQGVEDILLCSLWKDQQLIGFIGADQGHRFMNRKVMMKKAAQMLELQFTKEEVSGEDLQNEFSDFKMSLNILDMTILGLWIIKIDSERKHFRMIANKTMKKVLGAPDGLSPEEYYEHWYSRINEGYYHYVNQSVESMITTGEVVQLEYTWKHPQRGEVVVRCVGAMSGNQNGEITLEGYHRVIDDMEQTQYLSRNYENEMFEFHEMRSMIYFHSARNLIFGGEKKEEGFPESWIRRGIVHPYFVEEFRKMFHQVDQKEQNQSAHMMFQNKEGEYDWFKLETRRIGEEKEDLHTLIVLMTPMLEKKLVEFEYRRTNDFYKAMLSETEAFAEVCLDDGIVISAGGLWETYRENKEEPYVFRDFAKMLIDQIAEDADKEKYKEHLKIENLKAGFRSGVNNLSFQYQKREGSSVLWRELVVHLFQEEYTEDMYALIYQKNIHTEKELALENERAARYDSLTNVLNRSTFEKQMNAYVQAMKPGEVCAFLLFDIDDFKRVNDTRGHLEGDHMLKELTEVLEESFRSTDLIGRLGGDEFMVFVRNIKSEKILRKKLDKMYQRMQKGENELSCSCGICMIQKDNFQYMDCLKRADEALYESKRSGKNHYTFAISS